MKKITLILLGSIFVLALFFRFWRLGDYPEAIDEDEMALGYYAYSLIQNGTDEYGHKFPIYFESAGDYKYGLYSYFDTIPVFLFGLNPVTTRSVSAVAGSLSVIAIFFLALEIFKKEEYGLFTSFVLAFNPTHIHFSRVAYNNILGALFAIVSITLYLRWIKGKSLKNAALSFLAFLLAIYSYQAYRIFLPIVFILLPVFLLKITKIKKVYIAMFSGLAIFTTILSFVPAQSRARSQNFSLLVGQPMITEQIAENGLAGIPPLVTRIFDNKVISFTLGYSQRFYDYFEPHFLFVSTSHGTERHSTLNIGLLYMIEAPFLLLGLLYLTKFIPDRKMFIPLILLFAAPLAAASVIETVSPTRAVILVYGYSLFIALGIYALLYYNKKIVKPLLGIVIALYIGNFLYFFHQYTVHKIYHHPWYSDVGLKEMVAGVNKVQDSYKNVVMTGGHYIPYLFYNQISPTEFIENSTFNDIAQANGVRVKTFGKLVFNSPDECPTAGKADVLYVCFGYKVPQAAKLIEVIRYRDGQPAIVLVEFVGVRNTPENLPERVEYSREQDVRFPDGILPANYETFWPTR